MFDLAFINKINTKHEIEHVLPLMTTGLNQAIYVQIKNLVQGLVNKKSVRSSKTDMISVTFQIFSSF